MRIELTREEVALFELVLGADAWAGLGQVYRVAGGWVRDKLLGGGTVDIDFALDTTTGRAFLDVLKRYVDAHKHAGVGVRGERVPKRGLGRGYLVGQNAAKSKHLETAGVTLFGITAEFVHLRSETYADESRVPTVEFGTVESDASRRDLTINAMYYRLDTGEVEDYVGGLADLEVMRLRTPLDPVRTFVDDPLRVLRVLRFYSRFDRAAIDEAALAAMREPVVRASYERKLAPERASAEVQKLFEGAKPGAALAELVRAGLGAVVFGDAAIDTAGELPAAVVERMQRMPAVAGASRVDRGLALLAGWLWSALGGPKAEGLPRRLERALKPIGVGRRERGFVRAVTRGAGRCLVEHWDTLATGRVFEASREPGVERDDLWRFAVDLAAAWAAETGGADGPGDGHGLNLERVNGRRADLCGYETGGVPLEPLLGGEQLMAMFPELEPRTGFIKAVQQELVDRQFAREVRDEAEARAFVASMAERVRARFGGGA